MKAKNKGNGLAEMIMMSNSTHNMRLVDYTIKLVANYYNIEYDFAQKNSRKREICFPRQVAMYLLKENTNLSLSQIGMFFNGKDHATVLHAKRTIVNLMQSDKQINDDVKKLQKVIKFKSSAIKRNINMDKEFYYIDLNDYTSFRIKDNKAILVTGFSPEEISEITNVVENIVETRNHLDTGLYIIEQKTKLNDSHI
jgi:glutaredoxin 2